MAAASRAALLKKMPEWQLSWPKRSLVLLDQTAAQEPEIRTARRATVPYPSTPAVILVVEDDQGDQLLIQEALEASRISKQVHIVGDGVEALEYLRRSGRFSAPAEAPRPDLILLDLNMPRLGGKDLAAQLKNDPGLKTIPVVAFTTSVREEDVASCYLLGFNSYVQKPTDFDQFQAVLGQMEHYWLQVSVRAPRPR
jgi:two-component system response regulator